MYCSIATSYNQYKKEKILYSLYFVMVNSSLILSQQSHQSVKDNQIFARSRFQWEASQETKSILQSAIAYSLTS